MAASLTRQYNLGPEALRQAVGRACAETFRRPPAEWPPGSFTVRTPAFRWPLMSYGEKVEALISAPGTVSLYSAYVMLTQFFELGDNVANVERLARAIEAQCASLPRQCPFCGAKAADTSAFCTACGQALLDTAGQAQVPNRARSVRAKAWLWLLLVMAIPIGLLVAVYASILNNSY